LRRGLLRQLRRCEPMSADPAEASLERVGRCTRVVRCLSPGRLGAGIGEIVSGDVDVIDRCAAGQGDVAGFLRQGGGAAHKRDIDGGALGFVHGHRVAVPNVAGAEQPAVNRVLLPVDVDEAHGPLKMIDADDLAARPVEHPECAMVAGDDDRIADRELLVALRRG
jgi:hypothetical protein